MPFNITIIADTLLLRLFTYLHILDGTIVDTHPIPSSESRTQANDVIETYKIKMQYFEEKCSKIVDPKAATQSTDQDTQCWERPKRFNQAVFYIVRVWWLI